MLLPSSASLPWSFALFGFGDSVTALDRFLSRTFQSPRARAIRRGYPIHAYVGSNGGGKSAAMVWDTLPTLAAGRPVLSTVRLLDYENPRPCDDEDCTSRDHGQHLAAHPLWVPLTSWDQVLQAEFCDVLMDEVTGVASSRESTGMPAAVANLLVQLRRRDVVLRWSSPAWARADKIIRETSQAVTYCTGYFPVDEVDDGDADRQWRRRRMFKWSTYDAADFEDFTAGKRETLKPWTSQWFWGPTSPVFSAYDTMDAVLTIGTVLDTGRCATCGGTRRAPACSCDDYQRPARPARPRAKDLTPSPAPAASTSASSEGRHAAGGSVDAGQSDSAPIALAIARPAFADTPSAEGVLTG